MKIDGVKIPKSSFLSIEKDMGIIVDRICDNERLKRLLYYTTPDAMEKPNLTDDQMYELFKKNIKILRINDCIITLDFGFIWNLIINQKIGNDVRVMLS